MSGLQFCCKFEAKSIPNEQKSLSVSGLSAKLHLLSERCPAAQGSCDGTDCKEHDENEKEEPCDARETGSDASETEYSKQ